LLTLFKSERKIVLFGELLMMKDYLYFLIQAYIVNYVSI